MKTNDFNSPYVITNWQAQHPPLYYVVLMPIFKLLNGKYLILSAQILRLISLFIVSFALIPTYFLLRLFFDEKESLFGLLLFSCYPATFILFGHITNDCLAFPIFTSLILLTLSQFSKGITLFFSFASGLLLGLGLITKLYMLTAFPVILFVYIHCFLKQKDDGQKNILKCLSILCLTAFIIGMPWFLYNIAQYRTWNPTVHSVVSKDFSFIEKASFLGSINWKSFFVSQLMGSLWSGNWSFVTFPDVVYKFYASFLCVVILLYILHVKNFVNLHVSKSLILVLFSLSFLLGLIKHQLDINATETRDVMGGWYWTVLLPTHITVFFFMIQIFFKKYFWIILSLCTIGTYCITSWGNFGMLLPYYTGYSTQTELKSSFFFTYPLGESLKRIANLNSISFSLIPFLFVFEVILLIWILFNLIGKKNVEL